LAAQVKGEPAPAQSNAATLEARVISLAEQVVTEGLRDPQSAMFRNVTIHHRDCHSGQCIDDPAGQVIVCGEVNAKNGFGGYTGFEGFVVWNGRVITHEVFDVTPQLWADACGPN
jgi:hypothetical protein